MYRPKKKKYYSKSVLFEKYQMSTAKYERIRIFIDEFNTIALVKEEEEEGPDPKSPTSLGAPLVTR